MTRWPRVTALLFCAALEAAVVDCGRIGLDLLVLDASAPDGHVSQDDDGGQGTGGHAMPDAGADSGTQPMPDAGADSGTRAMPDAGTDSGTQPMPDAGADLDAGNDAGQAPACEGELLYALCWYLAPTETSCNDACASHGGFDARGTSYVGTQSQGGSLAECSQLMSALGRTGSVEEGTRSDDYGMGCHVWTDGTNWWLNDPGPLFRPTVSAPGARIVCACVR